MTRYHGHVWQSEKNGEWRWHVQHVNGNIVAQGEGYENEVDMRATLDGLFGTCEPPIVFERIDDPNA